jgi:hypothetical protein
MTADTLFIRDTLREKRYLRLEARVYEIEDLELPAGCTLEGAGMGLTELRIVGGTTGIRVRRDGPSATLTLRNFSLITDAFREAMIWVSAPALFTGWRGHTCELVMEHVEVLSGGEHGFRRGVVAENLLNARLHNVSVRGPWHDQTPDTLSRAEATVVAFDFSGSQEAKLSECYVHGARVGFYSNVPTAGGGEGHAIDKCAFINVMIGARVDGQLAGVNGGFNTPWFTLSRSHIFFLNAGVLAVNYHDVHIDDNSFCVSHQSIPTLPKIGVYFVQVANGHVSGNTFWDTSLTHSVGILGDRSIDCTAEGNQFDASTSLPVSLTPGSARWRGQNIGNVTADGKSRTRDLGQQNDVR